MGAEEVLSILGQIWPYLLVGIGVGALIHGWVPTNFFTTHAGRSNPFGVLLAVGIGIPLYSNAAGVMPMVQAPYEKGLPMGTVLAFMMSVVALSEPELILLRQVLQPPWTSRFSAVAAGNASPSKSMPAGKPPSWASSRASQRFTIRWPLPAMG